MLVAKKKKTSHKESSQTGILLSSHSKSFSHIPPIGLCIISLNLVQPPPFFLQYCAADFCAVLPGHSPWWVGTNYVFIAPQCKLAAEEAEVTETSFAAASPRRRFHSGKWGSSKYPHFPPQRALSAGFTSKTQEAKPLGVIRQQL